MISHWTQLMAYFSSGLLVIVPIYLIAVVNRFYSAFFATWFFIVAATAFSVQFGQIRFERGLASGGSDTTEIGLTIFSGWLLALPYCGALVLIRQLFIRLGMIKQKPD